MGGEIPPNSKQMRDQDKITYNAFKGLWSRGDNDTCPPDHFIDCENIRFDKIGIESREGSTVSLTRAGTILRTRIYKPLTGTQRTILMETSGTGTQLFDLTFSTVTPILDLSATPVANICDFSLANMYGRAYISFHARTIASAINNMYVYDGTGPTGIRVAGGAIPTVAATETATGAGNIEAGNLLITYCYETVSGFITAPIVSTIINHAFAANGNSITVTIPNGPAGTAAKRILAAKTIPAGLYNGDYRSQEFFFVPGNGRIPNNVTTSVTLSFFNSELVDSADFLFDNIVNPLGGLFMTSYGSRLVTGGDAANPSIVRFSEPGNPEVFSATDGFVVFDPSEQRGVKNGFEYSGSFIVTKSKRTYVTSDNGNLPSTWNADTVDPGIGTECNGISIITDIAGAWKNIALIADRAGLMIFNGTYGEIPLTDKIKDWWDNIDKAIFDQIQVLVDTQLKRIYCLIPKGDDNTLPYPNTILVGNYANGLTPQDIRWSPWAFYSESWGIKTNINCIMGDTSSSFKTQLRLGMNTDFVLLDPTVHNDLSSRQSIPSFAQFAYCTFDANDEDMINTFISIRLRMRGLGRVFISMVGIDDSISKMYKNYVDVSPTPGYSYEKLVNFVALKMSITLHMNTQNTQPFNDNYWQLTKMLVFGKTTWAALPGLNVIKT